MTTSLDTSVVIDIVNGRSRALRERFLAERLNGRAFVISSLVLHEFATGTALLREPARQLTTFHAVFGDLPTEPFSSADALESARMRAELIRAGRKLEGLDVLIAGQARVRAWTVATGNLKHFERMPNLSVEDWSA